MSVASRQRDDVRCVVNRFAYDNNYLAFALDRYTGGVRYRIDPVRFIQHFTRMTAFCHSYTIAVVCLAKAGRARWDGVPFGQAGCGATAIAGLVSCIVCIAGIVAVGVLIDIDNRRAIRERAPH
jgi:hypothetical protein